MYVVPKRTRKVAGQRKRCGGFGVLDRHLDEGLGRWHSGTGLSQAVPGRTQQRGSWQKGGIGTAVSVAGKGVVDFGGADLALADLFSYGFSIGWAVMGKRRRSGMCGYNGVGSET